ncbi:MAG: 30S ribosomal protein S18 [Verrucomicrobiae bacterium]|nr:30S ribosomal protein S18 [Verrucomicrobiae bacterium]
MGTKPAKRKGPRRHTNSSKKRVDVNIEAIDYKNTELLRKFVTEKGKILPRRVTGLPAALHRRVTQEIKRSRTMLLMK